MARIETYGRDNFITAFDKVIGTDQDTNRATKNYEMRDIRDYVVSGLPPNGGLLKVTHVEQDTPIEDIETPEDLLNSLAIPLDVVEYEIVIVSLTFNDSLDNDREKTRKFLLNKMMVTYGSGEPLQATSSDFILIEKEDVDLLGAISNSMLSIGDEGVDVYKGYNNDKHEIRKIKSDSLEVSIDGESVKAEIPQSILDSSNETIDSIGDEGVDVYKGLNGSSHEIRKIKSDTLLVSVDGDSIKIEAEEVDLGGVRNFYVNNKYTGDEELGTIAKPYKTIDAALTDYIGSGDIYSPEFAGSTVVVQTSNITYSFNMPLNIKDFNIVFEEGSTSNYIGSQEYMYDSRELLNHPSYQSTDTVFTFLRGFGTVVCKDKGIFYARGCEGYSTTNVVILQLYDNLTFLHSYKIGESEMIPMTDGGVDYYSVNGVPTLFSLNDAYEQPAIVCDGDNLESVNIRVFDSFTLSLSNQKGILIKNKGYFFKDIRSDGSIIILNLAQHAPKVGTVVNLGANEIIPSTDFNYIDVEWGNFYTPSLSVDSEINTDGVAIMESCIAIKQPPVGEISFLNIFSGVANSCLEFRYLIDNQADPSRHTTTLNNISTLSGANEYIYNNSNVNEETSLSMNNCILDKPISPNIDLTRGNTISVSNTINNQLVESLRNFPDRVTASASLPVGGLFVNTNSNDVDTTTHFLDTVI